MSAYEATLFSVGSVIALGLLAAVLYRLLRPLFNVTVTCWFCHQKSVVPYENRNCWDCLMCDQYNGFADDGGYNKAIPAQHIEELNHPVTAGDRKDGYLKAENGLCETCNRNQQLKIYQLANFVPYHEANFDAEVSAYAEDLESVYQLCSRCIAHVDATLRQQDAVLSPRLLDERLRKTASERSSSSHSRSHSSSASQLGRPVHCRQPPAPSRLLSSALDCLSGVCATLIAASNGPYLLPEPVVASVAGLVSALPSSDVVSSWFHATWPGGIPFTHNERTILLAFTGLCAKLTALVVRGFLLPLYVNILAVLAWGLLAVDALWPSWLGDDTAAARQMSCTLAAGAAAALSLWLCPPPRAAAANKTKVRKAGYARSSSSYRTDSPTSDYRTCFDSYAGSSSEYASSTTFNGRADRSIVERGGARSRTGYAASSSPLHQQQPLDVQSSLGNLCLGNASAASPSGRTTSHVPRARSISGSQWTGQTRLGPTSVELHAKASATAPEPLIRPGRLSPAPPHLQQPCQTALSQPAVGGLATMAAAQSFQDLRHFSGSLPTEKGANLSYVRSCVSLSRSSQLPPSRTLTRPFSEDGSVSYLSSSYRTAGVPRSVADMIAQRSAACGLRRPARNGPFETASHADKPLFAKFVIGISVGLNVTALALLAHQYVS